MKNTWRSRLAVPLYLVITLAMAGCVHQPPDDVRAENANRGAQPDPCHDKRVPKPESRAPNSCTFSEVSIERDGKEQPASLIQLFDGMHFEDDMGWASYRYFVRTKDGHIFDLKGGDILKEHNALFLVLQKLQITAGFAEGTCCFPKGWAYKSALVQEGDDKICSRNRMLPPFEGELTFCEGEPPRENISYMPGVLHWSDAAKLVCEAVAKETSSKCENLGVAVMRNLILRNEAGRAYYSVETRRRIRNFPELRYKDGGAEETPVEYEKRIYDVDPVSHTLTLVEKSVSCAGCEESKKLNGIK